MQRILIFLSLISVGNLTYGFETHFSRSCTSSTFSNQCDALEDGGSLSDLDCLKVVNNMGSEGRDRAGDGIDDACCDSPVSKRFTGFNTDPNDPDNDIDDACENFDVKLIAGGAQIQVSVAIDEDTCTGRACPNHGCGGETVGDAEILDSKSDSFEIDSAGF